MMALVEGFVKEISCMNSLGGEIKQKVKNEFMSSCRLKTTQDMLLSKNKKQMKC